MRLYEPLLLYLTTSVSSVLARPTKEPECLISKSVKLSFYGRQDVTEPIVYTECGRKNAGGIGTFESPLTMASAPGEFSKCEVVYIPYLLKYVRFEDICVDCVKDYAQGKLHMQIWTGNMMLGGEEQRECQQDFTPTFAMPVIRSPSRGLVVDEVPLYVWGAAEPCRLDHRYRILNVNAFCYDKTQADEDHMQDEKNSVNALPTKYERPAQEEAYYEPEPIQEQVGYDTGDPDWQLQQESDQPRIIL